MKKDKAIIITLSTIIIILILGLLVYTWYKHQSEKVLSDSSNQVELLNEIYSDFISKNKEENATITFDNSALTNFITKEIYSNSDIEKLKELEINLENPNKTFTFSIMYDDISNCLTLFLKENGSSHSISKNYYLNPSPFNINYKTNNISTITN